MKIKCIIIDDEPLAADLLESYVTKTPFLELKGKFQSAVAACDILQSDDRINLVFLDIMMPEINGLEFAKMVHPDTRIIFTTAYSEYAVDAFRSNALDYLLKPINYQEFLTAANKALEWFTLKQKQMFSNETQECIYVKSEYKLRQILLDDILYIEGLKDYLKIYLESEPRPVLSLLSMKSMEEHLPSPRFMRVHRSFMVNTDKINSIDKGQILFGKTRIPISESYKAEINAFLNERTL